MNSLISIITAVLRGDETISELPGDQLYAFEGTGKPFDFQFSTEAFLKIVRLQTLIFLEQERAGIPSVDAIKQMCSVSGQTFDVVMVRSLQTQEDATRNIIMLERLIVGLVREVCPAECERFGVRYVADISARVCWCQAPDQRFLD